MRISVVKGEGGEILISTEVHTIKESPLFLVGKCPFHEDQYENFVYSPKTGKYDCMSCGAKGTAEEA
jgi:DNA primase